MKSLRLRPLDVDGPEGIYLVRVDRARRTWHGRRPLLHVELSVLAPGEQRGRTIVSDLDCSGRQQWLLRWFLRDFGCPTAALCDGILDLDTLAGRSGVVRATLSRARGRLGLALDGFAPASSWPEFQEGATA